MWTWLKYWWKINSGNNHCNPVGASISFSSLLSLSLPLSLLSPSHHLLGRKTEAQSYIAMTLSIRQIYPRDTNENGSRKIKRRSHHQPSTLSLLFSYIYIHARVKSRNHFGISHPSKASPDSLFAKRRKKKIHHVYKSLSISPTESNSKKDKSSYSSSSKGTVGRKEKEGKQE